MAVDLAIKYAPYTDELFKAESKTAICSNQDYDWTGAHTIKIYKISTSELNDYARNVTDEDDATFSRYGALLDLSAATEEVLLKNDRSFIFNIDKLDQDETANQLEAESALAREIREVVIPEVDRNLYAVMVDGAGKIEDKTTLSKNNVYSEILKGTEVLDDNETPDTERVIICTPAVYSLLKQATELDNTTVSDELKSVGVVGMLDGCAVAKVSKNRLPEGVNFIITHPACVVAPVKLEDYGIHEDTPLSSGAIVTGRICYDAFVLENKAGSIYVHMNSKNSNE